MSVNAQDKSNGYDAISADFIAVRSNNGQTLIQSWAERLPKGGSVLDVGAGSGKPLTEILIKAGFQVCALDASPKMVAAFKRNFPHIKISCEAAENSQFFNQSYDGILAVGLIFLLTESAQRQFITQIRTALKPNGRLLFSAPKEQGTWNDVLTGRPSLSLGETIYKQIMVQSGFKHVAQHVDEGGANYYEAIYIKP